MEVTFENALICDVICYTYKDKHYYSVVIFLDGKLYRISIPSNKCDEFTRKICTKTTLTAVMNFYDGKTKFKLA